MHFQKISTFLIWSEDWQKLADWYQSIFNFNVIEELSHPEDTGRLLELPAGGAWLWIGKHSEVHGRNESPHRLMFNIDVDSVTKAHQYLLEKGVECFAEPYKAPTFDSYFATYLDPDGNLFQIIGPQ